jgi:hypothetical protein
MSDLIREGWEHYSDIPEFVATCGLEVDRQMVVNEALKAFFAGAHYALTAVLESAGEEHEGPEGTTVRTYTAVELSQVMEAVLDCLKEIGISVDLITMAGEGRPN